MKFKTFIFLIFASFYSHCSVTVFNQYGFDLGLNSHKINAITEDRQGFIWVAAGTDLFQFDGIRFHQIETNNKLSGFLIQTLFVKQNNDILIGTKNHGLWIYQNKTLSKISTQQIDIKTISRIAEDGNGEIWIATDKGVLQLSSENDIYKPVHLSLSQLADTQINSINQLNDNKLLIAQKNHVYIFDIIHDSIQYIEIDQDLSVHDAYQDSHNVLWIATSKRIIRYDLKNKHELPTPKLKNASRILSLSQFQQHMWIASIDGGLYKVNIASLHTQQYLPNKNFNHSLSDKNIKTLYITTQGMLWAGGFSNGLNSLDLNLNNFQFETNISQSIECTNIPHIFSIKKENDILWLGNSEGLIKWNRKTKQCQLFNKINDHALTSFYVYDISIQSDHIWLASSVGLLHYDKKSNKISNHSINQTPIFFVYKKNDQLLLFGTSHGISEYNMIDSTYRKLSVPNEKYENISYLSYAVNHNNQHLFFPSTHGILYLTEKGQLQEFKALDKIFIDKDIKTLSFNHEGEMFISVVGKGIYHLNADHGLMKFYPRKSTVSQIITDKNKLWLSAYQGLEHLDLSTQQSSIYKTETAGNYLSLISSAYKDSDGTLYFGGQSGFIHFDPAQIKESVLPYPLIFTDLYLMNKAVIAGQVTETGFNLTKNITDSKSLEFSYKDTIIGFQFLQLNYNTPKDTQYEYKLSPVSSTWAALPGQERQLTFTNLKSGAYQLSIKASHFNQTSEKSINFTVNAPPWLSWWAVIIYVLIALALMYFYIKRKVANEKKINAFLNQQVKQQTQHIAKQKQTVEDLMSRKNEIFSNVSHEFRTPITLILGPIEELQKIEQEKQKKDHFDMIARNAKRLLSLVNQMLKLAQINETDKEQKQLVNVADRLNMIIEPFIYLAKKNAANLTIEHIDKVELFLTEDALETIVGNFLSNAIKYTSAGDNITIGTRKTSEHIEIYVSDTGCGIDKEQQQNIFKRFNRQHQGAAQGVGIGLALVKEVATLNQAIINVTSEINQGAEFSIQFPLKLSIDHKVSKSIESLNLEANHVDDVIMNDKQTVLVIDDNEDMRHYINTVLSQHFECHLATGGLEGIAKALKVIPDIIICDVMMPDIDGFQVCRQLRNEMITSHIPLVLLTAVNEKASRIKGWRENIDRYLNKPFDADELILQLKNILNTRLLLTKNIKSDTTAKKLDYLSEIDQKFIDDLSSFITKGYGDPLFNLEKMASMMMVSDRQLQRKTKALINKKPMDLVREIRLKEGAKFLAKGKQISWTSDVCGFSSVSYFSHSFKKSYGMTPKAYQKLNHNVKDLKD